MTSLRIIWLALRVGLLNELQYQANFFIQIFQSVLQLVTALAGLAVIFNHTNVIGGWRPAELLAQVGVYIFVGGAISFVIQPSMQQLIADVHAGTLDFTLLKPADSQLLVSVRQVQLWRLVDMALGLGVVIVALGQLRTDVGPQQTLLFAVTLLAGGMIIYSFWLILATCAFWVRIENILVVFQDMFEAGRWPVTIYPLWLRLALTFLVPIAFATTVPAAALTGHLTTSMLGGAITLALTLFGLARWFWMTGVRRYAGASA